MYWLSCDVWYQAVRTRMRCQRWSTTSTPMSSAGSSRVNRWSPVSLRPRYTRRTLSSTSRWTLIDLSVLCTAPVHGPSNPVLYFFCPDPFWLSLFSGPALLVFSLAFFSLKIQALVSFNHLAHFTPAENSAQLTIGLWFTLIHDENDHTA